MVDLRSDTVTRPSAGMRAAMACAEVGDETHLDVDDAGIERAASVLTGLPR